MENSLIFIAFGLIVALVFLYSSYRKSRTDLRVLQAQHEDLLAKLSNNKSDIPLSSPSYPNTGDEGAVNKLKNTVLPDQAQK